MKIVYCFDCTYLNGGIEKVTITKANGLADIEGNEIWLIVAENNGKPKTFVNPKIHIVDLNIGYGCTDAVPAPYYYDAEFKFKGMSGGCKWFYKAKLKSRIDEKTNYNFDLDIELNELLQNRVIFKPIYFIDIGGQDTNKGGSNTDKNQEKRIAGIEYMKLKWGKYFDYDFKSNKAKIIVNR